MKKNYRDIKQKNGKKKTSYHHLVAAAGLEHATSRL